MSDSDDAFDQLAGAAPRRPMRRPPPRRRGGGSAWVVVAAIVIAAVGGLFFFVSASRQGDDDASASNTSKEAEKSAGEAPDKIPAVARITASTGEVFIKRGEQEIDAAVDSGLRDFDDILLKSFYASCTVAFEDEKTTVRLTDGARVRFSVPGGAKKLEMFSGRIVCDVAEQAEGKPMMVRTANGEAIVHGTRFGMELSDNRTRLEVAEGTVGFRSIQGAEVVVKDGQFMESRREGVTRGELAPAVLDFFLVEADTGRPVPGHAPLRDGHVIELTKMPSPRLNLVVRVSSVTGCVQFLLDGSLPPDRNQSFENQEPYVLTGREPKKDEQNPPARIWRPEPGEHTLEARVFRADFGRGGKGEPKIIKFTVKP